MPNKMDAIDIGVSAVTGSGVSGVAIWFWNNIIKRDIERLEYDIKNNRLQIEKRESEIEKKIESLGVKTEKNDSGLNEKIHDVVKALTILDGQKQNLESNIEKIDNTVTELSKSFKDYMRINDQGQQKVLNAINRLIIKIKPE